MATSMQHAAGVLFSLSKRLVLGNSLQARLLHASRVAFSQSSDSGSDSGSSSSDDKPEKSGKKLKLTQATKRNSPLSAEDGHLSNAQTTDTLIDPKLATAAKSVAESLGGNANETESDLLKQLKAHANTTETQKATGPVNAMSMLKGMKVEKDEPRQGQGRFDGRGREGFGRRRGFEGEPDRQGQGRFDGRGREGFGRRRGFEGDPDRQGFGGRSEERFRRPSRPRQDLKDLPKLFEGPRLGVFSEKTLADTSKSDATVSEGERLSLFDIVAKENLIKAGSQLPNNAYEEMIQWTKEGKLWTFPVNNEAGMHEETSVSFHQHIFLEPLIADFPKKGPVRHFMELVITGLSKNPHLSVEQKKEHIQWYREYFADKKAILDEALSHAAPETTQSEQPSP